MPRAKGGVFFYLLALDQKNVEPKEAFFFLSGTGSKSAFTDLIFQLLAVDTVLAAILVPRLPEDSDGRQTGSADR
jgi:hypothetical protein